MNVAAPRPSTTVLLIRNGVEGLEVLMVVRRSDQLEFAGAMVFPGGVIDGSDADDRWLPHCEGGAGLDAAERARRVAGFRELWEETGILLVRQPRRTHPPAAGGTSFLDAVRSSGGRVDLSAMVPFAHWVTPEDAPKRYDTFFWLCRQQTDMDAVCDGWETVAAEWLRPAEAIRLGAAAERSLLFPTRCQLDLLAQCRTVEAAVAAACERRIVPVTPKVERRAGGIFVSIPRDAGYPRCEFTVPHPSTPRK